MLPTEKQKIARTRKPPWLKVTIPHGENYNWLKEKSSNLQLNTVCQEARCPNIGECWNAKTATFMLMGEICTRGCRFCSVRTARIPDALDPDEPRKLADTICSMNLKYVVITSVNRDDLSDQGSLHIAESIKLVKQKNPELFIEMLIPDFCGDTALVQNVMNEQPHVISHNVETVKRLTHPVRDPRAGYQQSLNVLHYIKQNNNSLYTKSSLMLGLGETHGEIIRTMEDLRGVNVDFLTLGQYLQPDSTKLQVVRFLHPDEFNELSDIGYKMGFEYVASGPLVRSSYRAAQYFLEKKLRNPPIYTSI
ncbi:MAG: lipoyl synthase [SAR324 cluster bacterium]|nr:lipoyl synthase [SAR324 cluster bacterium]